MNESDVRLHRKLMTKYGIRGRLFSASGDCLGCGAQGYDTRKHDTDGYEEYGPCVVGCAVQVAVPQVPHSVLGGRAGCDNR